MTLAVIKGVLQRDGVGWGWAGRIASSVRNVAYALVAARAAQEVFGGGRATALANDRTPRIPRQLRGAVHHGIALAWGTGKSSFVAGEAVGGARRRARLADDNTGLERQLAVREGAQRHRGDCLEAPCSHPAG